MRELFTARFSKKDADPDGVEEIRTPSERFRAMEVQEVARRESRLGKAGMSLGMMTVLAFMAVGAVHIVRDPQGFFDEMGITGKMEKVVEVAENLKGKINP